MNLRLGISKLINTHVGLTQSEKFWAKFPQASEGKPSDGLLN